MNTNNAARPNDQGAQTTATTAQSTASVVDIQNARPQPPPAIPDVSVSRLNAGVELARMLLYIIILSFSALILYLIWMDGEYVRSVDRATDKALQLAQLQTARVDPRRVEAVSNALGEARKTSPLTPSASQIEEGKAAIDDLRRIGIVDPTQADRLTQCLQLPSDTTKMQDCLSTMRAVKDFADIRGNDVERLRLLKEIAKEAREHHQAFRAFWIQSAQLVLLNLYLPVLTALLGYIFGSRERAD